MERRLTAILAADVQGYNQLFRARMGMPEVGSGTKRTSRALRRTSALDPKQTFTFRPGNGLDPRVLVEAEDCPLPTW